LKSFKKIVIKTHQISGLVLSLMFVVWFASGIVLLFAGFPHASRNERFLHLKTFSQNHFYGLLAPSTKFKGRVELELTHNKPVYRVYTKRKAQQVFDAATLKPVADFTEKEARQLSVSFTKSGIKEIVLINSLEQWIPWSYYKPLLPFYKCFINDADHTVLYISKKTGTIVQKTNKKNRLLAWIGAIPHWIYFSKLRQNTGWWRFVVILISVVGIVVSASGIIVGFIRIRKKRGITPYKKFWYKWHHLTGFFFGLFVFTFILSGFFSMVKVPDWLAFVNSEKREKISWNNKLNLQHHHQTTPLQIWKALEQKTGIRKIAWKTIHGTPAYFVYYNNYQQPQMYWLINNKIEKARSYTMKQIKQLAANKFKNLTFSTSIQKEYDNYYSASAMHYLPYPAFKIKLNDTSKTWLYINPATGEEIRRLTKNQRIHRWLYRFLHTFDLAILKKSDGIRKTILFILSIFGMAVSFTGLLLSIKWLNRKTKK
jgi:hypothetical protein